MLSDPIPTDVREWWLAQFRTDEPCLSVVARARQQWPDRDCGRDMVQVMYADVYAPAMQVAA